jgi:D-sedoheptulose 7-phosphate isomerase
MTKESLMPEHFLKQYLSDLTQVFSTVDPREFDRLVEELRTACEARSNIFVCGNGGSASTASHFACDLNKGASYGKDKRFKIICLNDNVPTMLAYANDVSYDDVFVEQLKNFLEKSDVVIGISGSGNSKNVLKAVEYANMHGGRTFGVCGYGGGLLGKLAHQSLIIRNNDMQKVEDLHFIVLHIVMQFFCRNDAAGSQD